MATYPPPNFTEPLSVFNPANWETFDIQLTTENADKRYLKYPVAQGLETLQEIIVNGNATFNEPITIADGTDNTTITMNGTTNVLTTLNNVNSGTMVFAVKDNTGIQKNIFTGSAISVNLNGDNEVVMSGGTTTYTIQTSGTSTNAPMTIDLPSASNTGLVLTDAGIVQSGSVVNGLQNIAMNANQTIGLSTAGAVVLNDYGANIQDNITITTDPTSKDFEIVSNTLSAPVNVIAFTPSTNTLTTGATQPASSDSSNKIPTTAWVQSAIAGSVSQSNSAEHYSTSLNNTFPFGTTFSTIPIINFADVGTYASTYGMNYWDAVVFDFVFNLTISGVNTNATDAGSVMINNNQCSGTIYIYPTAFITSYGSPNYPFYLTGSVGSSVGSGSSTYYSCPITPYTTNGRPFWVNNLLNQGNIAVCMPCYTYNDGTNAKLVLQFAPINWNTTTQCNYNLSLTLRNSGKLPASKITTQNFNINNI